MTRSELIAALEKADGPSRELDAEVGRIAGWAVLSSFTGGGYRAAPPGEIDCKPLPDFTSSIDAALTLVPAGCDFGFEVEHVFGGPCVYARCEPGGWIAPVAEHRQLVTIQRDTQAEAATMIAIALCIAALKAGGD